MDKFAIAEFAGLYLQRNKNLTARKLQKFIMNREEVGKAIPIDEIEDCLSMLQYASFIKPIHTFEGEIIYDKDRN